MAEPEATHPALAHVGAWTEDAYLDLPADGRIELVDGSLLIGPRTDDRRDRAVSAVRAAIEAALPAALTVEGPSALRLSPGRILVPDLVVTARQDIPGHGDGTADGPGADRAAAVRDSSVALLVVDVVGRGNGVADRWFKPQLYAGSRIPYALLVDHDEPFAVGNMLIGGRYHEYAGAGDGEVLHLEEPFAFDRDLATLAAHPAAESDPPSADAEQAPDPVPH